MRILLDSHIFVWWLANDRKLPKAADALILDPDNEIHVSATRSIGCWSRKAVPNPCTCCHTIGNWQSMETLS